jgi:asparagine synthase (glutamine-hydrolysing)
MCGVVGVYHYRARREVDPEALLRAASTMAHRGPDGEGVFVSPDKKLGLGHRRLSIIDLEGGSQPMTRGPLSISYNGEIYNFPQLRAGLEQRGRRFATRSDTEVILQLFEEYGLDALPKLNGIFAFAIWDQARERLVLARDALGVKPLYYSDVGGTLRFASEIKAIVCDREVPREIDEGAIAQCLALRFVPSPATAMKGLLKLPPGSALSCDARGVSVARYWQPSPALSSLGLEDAVVEYRERLATAVERQMISDVPIGLMLSGGVDSAVLAALMRKASNGPLKSYTVGFEGGEDTSELEDARATARLFDFDHHEVIVSAQDYERFFSDFIWHQEEPLGNESAPAAHFVARLARPDVKVLLTGQGADEPLAGYDRYKGERYSALLRRLPRALIAEASKAGQDLLGNSEKLQRSLYALGERDVSLRFLRIY